MQMGCLHPHSQRYWDPHWQKPPQIWRRCWAHLGTYLRAIRGLQQQPWARGTLPYIAITLLHHSVINGFWKWTSNRHQLIFLSHLDCQSAWWMVRAVMKKKAKQSDLALRWIVQSPEKPKIQTSMIVWWKFLSGSFSDEEDGFGDGELTDTRVWGWPGVLVWLKSSTVCLILPPLLPAPLREQLLQLRS